MEFLKTLTREQLLIIADTAPVALAYIDAQLHIRFVNEVLVERVGLPRESLLDKHLGEVLGESRFALIKSFLEKALAGDFQEYEIGMPYGGLGLRHLHIRCAPVANPSSNVDGIIINVQDITQKKTTEEAMRESEQRFRALVEPFSQAVWEAGADGIVLVGSRTWEAHTGQAENESLGEGWAEVVHPEDREQALERWRNAVRTRKPTINEYRLRVASGGYQWTSVRGAPIFNSDGSVRKWVGTIVDISDQKLAEQAINEARRVAEEANRLKDEFLATLSHELRTPLAAIMLWSKMLRAGNLKPEQVKAGIEAIASAADAQNTLIEDLLDTSRISSGRLRLQMSPVDLSPTVQQAIETVRATAQSKEIELRELYEGDAAVTVWADANRLRQIIWNLLTNALKFTPRGGWIEVAVSRTGSDVIIRVTDNGEGIAADLLPKIFDLFRQGASSAMRSHGGLGLGLTITRQLVQLHGGSIRAESDGPGKGAVFTIHLPIVATKSTAGRKRLKKSSRKSARTSSRGKLEGISIMIIEDDQATREALTVALQQAGAKVCAHDSAGSACRNFGESRAQVIISDIGLPDQDGYSLIRQIRECETKNSRKPIPAIALSAFARESDQRAALKAGFNHYLAKPVAPSTLVNITCELLGTSKSKTKRKRLTTQKKTKH